MLTIIICAAAFIGVAALVGGVAIMFRGSGSSEVEGRLDILTGAASAKDAKIAQASVLHKPLDDVPGAVEEFVARFGNANRFFEQADVPFTMSRFVLISGVMAAAGGGLCLLAPISKGFVPLAAAVLGTLPLLWVYLKRKKRLGKFGRQLPDALELISRALRAGHSLAAAFQLVGEEMPAPISSEFRRVYEEQNLGIPLEEALDVMTERVPNVDLRFLANAVILQRQTGGDLAEILDKIGHLVRERFKIFGQIQALTGEGRLSGIVLLALPPVLFGVMYYLNPGYVMTLFTDPMGKQMLAVALILQVVGALVIRKIINIKV